MAPNGQLTMENAEIIFRNFAGKEGMYNAEGDRNFCVLLGDDTAGQMSQDGWNIKQLRAREEEETPQSYIQVSLKYRGKNGAQVRQPTVVMITSKGRTTLPEDMIEMMDWVDIKNVDLIIRPFEWAVNGKTGIKAYLKSIYITILEDALQLKYADVPELDASGQLALEQNDASVIDGEWEEVPDEQRQLN